MYEIFCEEAYNDEGVSMYMNEFSYTLAVDVS